MKPATRTRKVTEHEYKSINSFLDMAIKPAHQLSGAIFSARENSPTRERFLELVRDIATTDYLAWRERMNYSFRAIRDVLATPTGKRRAARRRTAARRQARKVMS